MYLRAGTLPPLSRQSCQSRSSQFASAAFPRSLPLAKSRSAALRPPASRTEQPTLLVRPSGPSCNVRRPGRLQRDRYRSRRFRRNPRWSPHPRQRGLEHFFKTLDLALGLFPVRRKRFLQFGLMSRLHHLGECPIDLLLSVINVFKCAGKRSFSVFSAIRISCDGRGRARSHMVLAVSVLRRGGTRLSRSRPSWF